MNTYDAGKHPRGQVGNAGQFRNKSWSDPEVDLVTMPPRVDLASWIPGDDVDADAQVLDELQWVRAAVAVQRSPAIIADELIGSAYAENIGNRNERSINEMLTELAAVGGITWDMLAAAAYEGQLNFPPVLATHTTTDFLASASRDYYAAGRLVELATAKRIAELVLGHYPTAAYMELEESDQESGGFWSAGIVDAGGDSLAVPSETSDTIVDELDALCVELPTSVPSEYDSAAMRFVPDPAYVWLHAPGGSPYETGHTPYYIDLVAAAKIDLGV